MKKWQLFLATVAMTTVIVAPAIQAEASTYTVQKGDTLFKIATKHQTTVASLKQLNNLQNDTIYLAQKLAVPTESGIVGGTNTTTTNTTTKTTIAESYTYKVVKGDTLTKIATKNATTVAKIKDWNSLKNNVIYVGQALIINQGQLTEKSETSTTVVTTADEAISAQLAKEVANKKGLTAATTKKYTKVVSLGKSLLGTPYVFGGNTPAGIDCSGFVYYAYKNAGFQISRKSSLDYFMNDTTKVDKPVPGDLVFFKNTYISTISHMGIYLGNNQFIHAGSDGVEISSLKYSYWDSRFVAFKRFNIVK